MSKSNKDGEPQAPLNLLEPDSWLPRLQRLLEGHNGFFFGHRSPQGSGRLLLVRYDLTRAVRLGQKSSKARFSEMLKMASNRSKDVTRELIERVYWPHSNACSDFVDQVIQCWDQLRPEVPTSPPAKLMSVMLDLLNEKITKAEFRTWVHDQAGLTGRGQGPGPTVKTQILGWEFLPAGWWGDQNSHYRAHILSGLPPKEAKMVQERLDFLVALRPGAWWRGLKLGGRQYHVAEFPQVAVAECALEGNAIYYLYKSHGDWRFVFTQSKSEALALGADRIIHDSEGAWRASLRRVVRS